MATNTWAAGDTIIVNVVLTSILTEECTVPYQFPGERSGAQEILCVYTQCECLCVCVCWGGGGGGWGRSEEHIWSITRAALLS